MRDGGTFISERRVRTARITSITRCISASAAGKQSDGSYDGHGEKMCIRDSGIDPLEIIDQYGADALRFTVVTGNSPGNDIRFSDEKVAASRNFANKIWNAARFIRMNLEGHEVENRLPEALHTEDQWIVSAFNAVAKEMTENLEKFELGIAVQKVYDFLWDSFCD